MINPREMIKKTRSFGLNSYEAKLWAALLSKGVSTAGELSDIANVPRSRSYDVLESLEKKGFVVMKLGKPIKYLAVPPKKVIERVKEQLEKNTERQLSYIKHTNFNNIITAFQELYERSTDHTKDIAAVIRGRKNIYKHLAFLFKDAKEGILLSTEPKTKEHQAIIDETKTKTTIKPLDVGLRMCLVDEESALIFPVKEAEAHPDYDLCIWIKNKHTTKFLKQILVSSD
ncbi:MAG: helix-turn-helix domain-containing protein [Candidatus Woesearchaeota archaeon]|jgi:sugar-specific transcriptional regulator TrmB|nr:helix-turn-helix domain-containing protein [Candidatus Woesearchaeota archaeon]